VLVSATIDLAEVEDGVNGHFLDDGRNDLVGEDVESSEPGEGGSGGRIGAGKKQRSLPAREFRSIEGEDVDVQEAMVANADRSDDRVVQRLREYS
jgi:hypothetical protein